MRSIDQLTAQNIPDHLISDLADVIKMRTGLYFPKERRRDLKRSLVSVAKDLGFDDLKACVQLLVSPDLTKKQLDTLIIHLTIGETFFFRDKNLFQVIKDQILARWVQLRQGNNNSLRFWSAGCCTGEEPYSIAMLLDQMKPEIQDWKITILATDINAHFLKKAEKGFYSRWSFRDTPDNIVKRYFKKRGENRFEIAARLKKMVNFCQLNLAEKNFPLPLNDAHSMDMIFCRNVLMYFAPETRARVIRRLTQSLVEGGWLIVSPSETAFVQQPDLNTVRFPGAVLHRKGPVRKDDPVASFPFGEARKKGPEPVRLKRKNHKKAPCLPLKQEDTMPAKLRRWTDIKDGENLEKLKQDIYQEALSLYEMRRYEESAKKLSELLSDVKKNGGDFLLSSESMALLAKACANLGRLEKAIKWSRQAVNTEKLNPGHHHLLSTIYQEQGDIKGSIRSLKHALYLDPEFVLAHFALGNLTFKEGRFSESMKHFKNSRALLLSMEPEGILPYSDGMTAGRLIEVINAMSNKEQYA